MKIKTFLTAFALIGSTFPVFAAGEFYGGVGINAVGGEFGLSAQGETFTFGQTETVASVDAGYTHSISSDWKLAVGLTFDLNDAKAGRFGVGDNGITITGKDHTSIYLQPMYAIGSNVYVFGKVGYHTIKGEARFLGSTRTKDFDGFGYGFGMAVSSTKCNTG